MSVPCSRRRCVSGGFRPQRWRCAPGRLFLLQSLCLALACGVGCQSLDLTVPQEIAKAENDKTETNKTETATATSEKTSETTAGDSQAVVSADAAAQAGASGETAGALERAAAAKVDPHLQTQFREWLDQDSWQVDVRWSVLDAEADCPTQPWRWIFVASSAPNSSATKSPDEAQAWAAVWSGRPELLSDVDRSAALAVLAALAHEDGRIGRHATVLRARLQPGTDAELLRSLSTLAAGDDQARSALRCAAAEAWCRCLRERPGDVETTFTPAGELLQKPGIAEDLRGTLWRAMAPVIVPDRLPGLAAAMNLSTTTPVPTVRRQAALEACVIAAATRRQHDPSPVYRESDWPVGILSVRLDDDPVVRRLVGRWAGWAQPPDGLMLLTSQTRDMDRAVQESALMSLGILGTPPARTALQRIANNPQETRRPLAVAALAHCGTAELEPYVTASMRELRVAAARGLARSPSPAAARLLQQLLSDRNPEVQSAALATARQYPSDLAIPLLLLAAEQGMFSVRKSAQLALGEHVNPPPLLPIEGTPVERRDAVREWASSRGISLAAWSGPAPAASHREDEQDPRQREVSQLVEDYLSPEASSTMQSELLDRLRRVATSSDLADLERQIRQHPGAAARTLQRELLPRISPAYSALWELDAAELARRRTAARQLWQASQTHPLSPDLLHALAEILVREQDHLVWQSCLAAVRDDGHNAAAQVAALAVHHVWPDLRRLGAEHFVRHPAPEAVPTLLPLLADPHPQVQVIAIRALGRSGNPLAISGLPGATAGQTTGGLIPLKSDRHDEVRWAAYTALAQLRDEQTIAELQRMLTDSQPTMRLRAVQAMGDSQQPRFVESLIRHSWTENQDVVKRAMLASLDQLVPAAEQPRGDSGLVGVATIDEKIENWVKWWDSQRAQWNTSDAGRGAGIR